MQQNECRGGNHTERCRDAAGSQQATKPAQRCTDGAVPPYRMVAVTPQPIPGERDGFGSIAGMLRVAYVAVAPCTSARINIVREDGGGPLLGANRRAADVTSILVGLLNAVAGAWLMVIESEVIQAQTVVAGRAAPRGLQTAFRAAWCGIDERRRHAFSLLLIRPQGNSGRV